MLREFSCLSVESDCYLRCYEFCVGGGGVRRRGGVVSNGRRVFNLFLVVCESSVEG